MRTIIIGDIHGCDQALRRMLEKTGPGEEDRLILLGDLFDRGPESWEVFQTVRALDEQMGERFVLLKGNHEDYLMQEKLTLTQKMIWDRVGRRATEKSFRRHGARMEDARPFLKEKCRLYWRGEKAQAVHAGVQVEPIEENDEYTLVHDHDIVRRNAYQGRFTVVGHIAIDFPTWFRGDGETTEWIQPGEWFPLPETGVLCIDTGCGKGGKLTGMVIEGDRYLLEFV